MRWLRAERGLALRRLRRALALVGRRPRRLLGRDLGLLRGPGRRRAASASSAAREMPGAEWFAGTELNYAEHVFAGKDDDEVAILHASELRELGELSWGELRAQVARRRRGPARARGRARRPRRRLHAEHPRGDRRLPRHRLASARSGRAARPTSAPASVIDRFAQIEPKVLFAVDGYRYGGKDFDRRERRRRAAGGDAEPGAHRRPPLPRPRPRPLRRCATRCAWDELLGAGAGRRARASSASPSTTRSGSSTPPARPGCRRRSSRARAASCSST